MPLGLALAWIPGAIGLVCGVVMGGAIRKGSSRLPPLRAVASYLHRWDQQALAPASAVATELEAASPPEGLGTELEAAGAPQGRGDELEAAEGGPREAPRRQR